MMWPLKWLLAYAYIRKEKSVKESFFPTVWYQSVQQVSLSAMGVSFDDLSGRGWVENDIGREGRWKKRERERDAIQFMSRHNAALSRQIIIHEPIYIIPYTGALSYHSRALKYRSLSDGSLPLSRTPSLQRKRRLCLCDRQKELRVVSSIESMPSIDCSAKSLMHYSRRHFRYAQKYKDTQSSKY